MLRLIPLVYTCLLHSKAKNASLTQQQDQSFHNYGTVADKQCVNGQNVVIMRWGERFTSGGQTLLADNRSHWQQTLP